MAPPDLTDKKILVVEDDDMSYLYLSQILLLTRCQLFRAKTGAEAGMLFQTMKVDAILMDIQLPDTDGLSVTAAIRASNPVVPVIAQTAGKTPEEADNALAAGCNAVLVKPVMMDKLFETLLRFL